MVFSDTVSSIEFWVGERNSSFIGTCLVGFRLKNNYYQLVVFAQKNLSSLSQLFVGQIGIVCVDTLWYGTEWNGGAIGALLNGRH
jgi:hypothetical protein